MKLRDSFKTRGQIEFSLKDKFGRPKKVWQEFRPFFWLRKKGLLALPQIPFLTGFWTEKAVYRNLIVNAGKAGMASRFNGDGAEAAFTYLAIGTGTVAPAATDTALGAEITTGGGARAAATASRVTTNVTNDTAQLDYTWTFTASFAITEMGVFNAASAGTMAARNTFAAVNVGSGDSFRLVHKTIFA